MANSEGDNIPATMTPGEMLFTAREEQGISRREMADRLNWRHDYLAAVEENRLEVLPGAAFVSGYLRTYAKLLGVAEDDVLAALRAMNGSNGLEQEPRRVETRLPQVQKHGFGVPIGVAAAVILVALMWWLGSSEEESQSVDAVSTQISTAEVDEPATASVPPPAADFDPESVSAEPVIAEAEEMPAQVSESARVAEAPAVQDTTELEEPAQESVVPVEVLVEQEAGRDVTETASLALASPQPGPAEGEETLSFGFSGDCWLEIRDASGELIYADLRRAGSSLNVSGIAPFRVLVGDASVVDLRFRNEAVNIPVRPGRTTARFAVGEL